MKTTVPTPMAMALPSSAMNVMPVMTVVSDNPNRSESEYSRPSAVVDECGASVVVSRMTVVGVVAAVVVVVAVVSAVTVVHVGSRAAMDGSVLFRVLVSTAWRAVETV